MYCKKCGSQMAVGTKFCPVCGTPTDLANQVFPNIAGAPATVPMSNAVPIATGNPAQYEVSSQGLRLANSLLDGIFIGIINFILGFIVGFIVAMAGVSKDSVGTLGFIVGILGWFFYYFIMELAWGRTIAKFITGTKVVMRDGSRANAAHIVGRTFSRYIPFDAFSFLFGRMGWHDRISKTIVVPSKYTEAEVKQIDLNNQKRAAPWIIVLVLIPIFLAILGLFASVVLLSLNSARIKSRDAKRVADVRVIQSGLELYYNDHQGYPASLSALEGAEYKLAVPVAPTPPDGTCTSEQNAYKYKFINKEEYMLNFCLGAETAGLAAGPHIVSPEGTDKVNSGSPAPVQYKTNNTY